MAEPCQGKEDTEPTLLLGMALMVSLVQRLCLVKPKEGLENQRDWKMATLAPDDL